MQDKISMSYGEKMDEGIDDSFHMSLVKLEQAQQKMDSNEYEAAIPILVEAAELTPTNYLILCALTTCYLNADSSYFTSKNDPIADKLQEIYEVFDKDIPELNSGCKALCYFIGSKACLIHPKPIAKSAMNKLAWIKKLDLSETVPRDESLNLASKRIWIALCIQARKFNQAIKTFEECSSFHEQFGWRELCSIADCYSMNPESSKKAIALYNQAYQKNPRMNIAYHMSWAAVYRALGKWDEVFKQLEIMAAKDMYDLGLRSLLNSLLENNYIKLETKFFPKLTVKPRPYHAVFWDIFFLKTIGEVKKELATGKKELPAFMQYILRELDGAFGTYPTFAYYLRKAILLRLSGREAMDELSQAIDLINVDFLLTTIASRNAYINIIFWAYATYYRTLCKKPSKDFTAKEAFNFAYARTFIPIKAGMEKIPVLEEMRPPVAREILRFSLNRATRLDDLPTSIIGETPLLKKMFTVAQEIWHLRLARAKAWQDNHIPDDYNFYTARINALLTENNITGQTNRTINSPPSLFVKAARTLRETHQRLPADCPPEIIARYHAVKAYPMDVRIPPKYFKYIPIPNAPNSFFTSKSH